MKGKYGLVAVIAFALGTAYGFGLPHVLITSTYQEDLNMCESACETNGGVESCSTSLYCSCENGASFSARDLR